MAQQRNLVSMSGTGRRASSSLRTDPGAARQAAALGQTDISVGRGLTVDKLQRLSIKQARPVMTITEAVEASMNASTPMPAKEPGSREAAVEDMLNALIINLRESGILES